MIPHDPSIWCISVTNLPGASRTGDLDVSVAEKLGLSEKQLKFFMIVHVEFSEFVSVISKCFYYYISDKSLLIIPIIHPVVQNSSHQHPAQAAGPLPWHAVAQGVDGLTRGTDSG